MIYLDNGATSFPKPDSVIDQMANFMRNIGSSVNRGAYESSYLTEELVFDTRARLADLFNFDLVDNVVFTKNVTESLNFLIHGLLEEGDHVIVSSMEHNAVMRPLNSIPRLEISRLKHREDRSIDLDDLRAKIKENTKALFILHGSNVSGDIFDIYSIGEICHEAGIYFCLDSAQTAGFTNIDFKRAHLSGLAFTGHKSLLGPQGIGGLLLSDQLARDLKTSLQGGTGSRSDQEYQPEYMPDKFEPGTPNIPGIIGLREGLIYIETYGLEKIKSEELELTGQLLEGFLNMEGLRVCGREDLVNRCPLISIDCINRDNGEIAHILSRDFNIVTRSGMHCAPSAHKILNTFPRGTIRFSISHFNSLDEIKFTLDSLNKILKGGTYGL